MTIKISVCFFLCLFISLQLQGQETSDEIETAPMTVDEVINRYLASVGGAESFREIKTAKMLADVQGNKLVEADPGVTVFFAGDKSVSQHSTGDIYGFDGKMRWQQRKGHDGTINKFQSLRVLDVNNPFRLPISIEKLKEHMRLAAENNSNVSEIVVLISPPAATPKNEVKLWPQVVTFDKDTGLLKSIRYWNQFHHFSDYQQVGSIRIPFRKKSNYDIGDEVEAEFVETIKSVELNIEIAEGFFEATTPE